jgi:hypothetical protein
VKKKTKEISKFNFHFKNLYSYCGGAQLESQLLMRWRGEDGEFKASLGKVSGILSQS